MVLPLCKESALLKTRSGAAIYALPSLLEKRDPCPHPHDATFFASPSRSPVHLSHSSSFRGFDITK